MALVPFLRDHWSGNQQGEAETLSLLSELDPRFRNADGTVNQAEYQEYLASLQPTTNTDDPTPEEAAMATFLSRRIEEASVAENFHTWPNNEPWNKQPWWKWEIWKGYWAGEGDGREEKYSK